MHCICCNRPISKIKIKKFKSVGLQDRLKRLLPGGSEGGLVVSKSIIHLP